MKPPRHRPQPVWAKFNQPQRSPASGKHRRADPPVYSDSVGEPSDRPRRAAKVALPSVSWRTISRPGRGAYLPFDRPEPREIPYAGVRTSEITAWRAWFIQEDRNLCSLVNTDCIWEPGKVIEGNVNEDVDPFAFMGMGRPLLGGVYSFFDREHCERTVAEFTYERITFPSRIVTPRQDPIQYWNQAMMNQLLGKEETITIKSIIGLAYGTVKLWGEVFEHEKGWRSQFAKIDEIIGVPRSQGYGGDLLRALQARYHRSGK